MATGETLTSAGTVPHLVIIVPGIRDRGLDWHIVRRELEAADFVVTITGWSEYFGIPRFLVPAPMFRRLAMKSLQQKIEDAVKTYTVGSLLPHVSYIAHSFGSYILCYLLRRRYHLRTHRLILCGSVLPRTFKFSSFEERFDGPVINDIGTKDYWPLVASCVTFGYGTIGTFGYAGEPVVDRFHVDADHGRFTEKGFCTKYWIPVLSAKGRDGIVTADKVPKEGTLRKSFMRLLQNLKWVVLVGFVWIAGARSADMYCQSELRPVHFLAWETDTLVWLNHAVMKERGRTEEQSHHICRYLPAVWPVRVHWPNETTVARFDDRLKYTAACHAHEALDIAKPAGIDALTSLAKAFPNCLELRSGVSPASVELLLPHPGNAAVREVAVEAPEGKWYLCDCGEAEVNTIQSLRRPVNR